MRCCPPHHFPPPRPQRNSSSLHAREGGLLRPSPPYSKAKALAGLVLMFYATSNAISNYAIHYVSHFHLFFYFNYICAISNRKEGPGTGGNYLKRDGDGCKGSSSRCCPRQTSRAVASCSVSVQKEKAPSGCFFLKKKQNRILSFRLHMGNLSPHAYLERAKHVLVTT